LFQKVRTSASEEPPLFSMDVSTYSTHAPDCQPGSRTLRSFLLSWTQVMKKIVFLSFFFALKGKLQVPYSSLSFVRLSLEIRGCPWTISAVWGGLSSAKIFGQWEKGNSSDADVRTFWSKKTWFFEFYGVFALKKGVEPVRKRGKEVILCWQLLTTNKLAINWQNFAQVGAPTQVCF